jgi:hypothetical protein
MKKGNYLVAHNDLVKKALVSLSIEKALLDVGNETYDKVAHELYERYHSYFQDCYEHPEYLSEILTQLYGNAGKVVVDSIKKKLEEFSDHKQIARLLEVISK